MSTEMFMLCSTTIVVIMSMLSGWLKETISPKVAYKQGDVAKNSWAKRSEMQNQLSKWNEKGLQ